MATFHATFGSTGSFRASFTSADDDFAATFSSVVRVSDYDAYEGPYTVKSVFAGDYTIPTDGKLMTADVTVSEIPVVRTSNLSGGQTVVIG